MMTFIIGFPIVLLLICFVIGIAQIKQDNQGNKESGAELGYLSDEDYLNNGGVIRYHHYGKTRE